MKQYLSWMVTNGTILIMLLTGLLYPLPSLALLAVAILWVTAISAILAYLAIQSSTVQNNIAKIPLNSSIIPNWLDAAYDLIVVGILVYFTYPILAIFYFLHIGALWHSRVIIGKLHETSIQN